MEFSPDGNFIASVSDDGQIRLWSLISKNILKIGTWDFYFLSVRFTIDGKYLVSGSDDAKIQFWDIEIKDFETIGEQNSYV